MNAHESSLSGYATGFAFLAPSDKLLDAEALTHYFASLTDSSDLRLRASALTGSWSYYSSPDLPQDRDAFAIVDHRSSHALYYLSLIHISYLLSGDLLESESHKKVKASYGSSFAEETVPLEV